ncbi:PhoX family protein [Sodalinema gerasimenkoae]|uniref:PhoX family protein n=1 Tax=Sodalinema gerasimenkoae TaxID=2862348 RepID=UPI001358D9D6|nr:PhoX family phosphatase [Sodalinema gerasimenkoae]
MPLSRTPQRRTDTIDNGDEPICNRSHNPAFSHILNSRLKRRQVLRGGLSAAVAMVLTRPSLGSLFTGTPATAATGKLGFSPISVSEADTIVVPEGYRVQTLIPWGEPITGTYPSYDLGNSGRDQGMQIGQHHDGMHFFPIEGQSPDAGSSQDGLLVLNHEYIEPRFLHAAAVGLTLNAGEVPMNADGPRDTDQVLKELNAHGISIVRIRQQDNGAWEVVRDAHNRRITGLTPMELAGPVRGSEFLKTRYSPEGTATRGTLNNCAHGVTPWNTYLFCEENWAAYFRNGDPEASLPREQTRYGVRREMSRYGWERAESQGDEYVRFDVSPRGNRPQEDYRNEANGFGWVVEVDPFNPNDTPKKRTALGRFAHEGVVFQPAVPGQPVVCYLGDDARFEYVYKYVSTDPYNPATASGELLDRGRLYVARFDENGSGEWLPLVFGEGQLTPENGFSSQADVLVNTRTAADVAGATKMDRPEWGAVDSETGAVYLTLTNNTRRTEDQVDAANPRPDNAWGHIIRWREAGDNPTATRFEWELFVLAGPEDDSETLQGKGLDETNIFASPDGLWFDLDRRLWIQTDISESVMNQGKHAQFGNNQMLAADPDTGEIRRFLTGPIGQEITGVVSTPDQRTLFINVQHPGATTSGEAFAAGSVTSRWPDHSPTLYPRSATVVITKVDGGVIGT